MEPGELTIHRGDEVLWLNTSGHSFSLIFDPVPGAPETPLAILGEFSARFDRPGTYRYRVHGMPGPAGASLRRPGARPAIVAVAAGVGIGWIIVK